jgi:hypothetical protein
MGKRRRKRGGDEKGMRSEQQRVYELEAFISVGQVSLLDDHRGRVTDAGRWFPSMLGVWECGVMGGRLRRCDMSHPLPLEGMWKSGKSRTIVS